MSEEREAVRRLKQELRLKKMRVRLREKDGRELARLADRALRRRKASRGAEESEEH